MDRCLSNMDALQCRFLNHFVQTKRGHVKVDKVG